MNKETLSFEEVKQRVFLCWDNNIPVLMKSGPGEGKTQSSKQWALEYGANCISIQKTDTKITVEHIKNGKVKSSIVINAVNKNPSHVNGLPHLTEDGASFAMYDFMREIYAAETSLIVIIDDVLLATQIMQGSFMNLIEERAVDGKPIPDCVNFIITTNEAGQGAGSGSILSPVINRCWVVDFPRDVDNWLKWGVENNVSKKLLLFIHAFPDQLFSDKYPKGITAFNSPRSFTKASIFMNAGIQDSTTLSGLVNPETAIKLAAFCDQLDKFGNVWAKIKADPNTAPVYNTLEDIYAVLLICSNQFEKANVSKIVQYFSRYGNDELLSILFAVGTQTFPDSKESKEYVDYVATNQVA